MISFIIHYRKDTEDRKNNIRAIISYYKQIAPICEIIVVNDDSVSRYDEVSDLLREQDSFFFYKNDGNYVRTLCFNYAATLSKRDFICFQDTDVIVSNDDINRVCHKIKGNIVCGNPHNGIFIDTRTTERDLFYANLSYGYLNNCRFGVTPKVGNRGTHNVMNINSVGGSVIFNRAAFLDIGGYAPMIGWGYEDNEIIERVQKLDLMHVRGEDRCYHLHHISNNRAENPNLKYNKLLYDNCRIFDRMRFFEYVSEIREQFKVNNEKFEQHIIKVK